MMSVSKERIMNILSSVCPISRLIHSAITIFLLGVCALIGINISHAQAPANAVESVSASTQGGQIVVRIDMTNPMTAVPTSFAVQQPARIALDFPNVASKVARTAIDLNQGPLRSANVAQSGDRTRVVLNLTAATSYKTEIQGKSIIVALDAPVGASVANTGAPVRFAENLAQNSAALKDIDFRRGNDGAGRVIVELPSNQVGVDIRQQGQQLVVEFLKTTLPENLRRRLDVTDFGTPVKSVTTFQNAERVRMVVEPSGSYEHSAYQSDTQFVLEVRPVKVDPNKLVQGPNYRGEKLSLNFQNIDIRSLLQVIADFTNFNVITSDTVTGNVTLRLKDVPWDQALDVILQAKNLGMKKQGSVLWIAPKDELATKEKLELEAKAQIAELEPLRTQGFQLNYTKAEDVAKGLTGQGGGGGGGAGGGTVTRILSKRGSALFEARTNQIFVNDIPSKLEEIASLISKIDIASRQVLIEARIVEADDKFSKNLGAKLGYADLRTLRGGDTGYSLGGNGQRITATGNYIGIGEQTGQARVTQESYQPNTNFVSLPAGGLNGFNAGSLAVSLFNAAANRFLNLEISALEADGKGKIISSPRVVTADQVKAIIEQGTELPYQTATSSGATSIAFRKANLKLEVTPQITPEGNIILNVDINKDSVGILTTAGYAIDTKHVQTQVLVDNGGTVVIGGIYQQLDRDQETKVPLLGDIPVVGNLFKNKSRQTDKTELLVFLTPRVIAEKTALR
jgi:type IV pilus assembly protein PilQ